MRPIVFLFLVSLLHSNNFHGSATLTRQFVLKGTDLLLEVTAPVHRGRRSQFHWKYNQTENIVRLFTDNDTDIHESYQGRVTFFFQNYSLLLNNVTRTDSGHYSAAVVDQRDEIVGEHSITVQDFVSPVHGKVANVSFSPDSCNLTVTCSTQDSYRINDTFRCNGDICSQDGGGGRSKGTTLGTFGVYLYNGSVICSHTNQISSANNTIVINDHCFPDPDPYITDTTAISVFILIPVVVVVLVVVVVVGRVITMVRALKKRRKSERSVDLENTLYETVQEKTVAGNLGRTPSDEAPAPFETTTYSLIGPVTMTQPESLYAQVKRLTSSEENH